MSIKDWTLHVLKAMDMGDLYHKMVGSKDTCGSVKVLSKRGCNNFTLILFHFYYLRKLLKLLVTFC